MEENGDRPAISEFIGVILRSKQEELGLSLRDIEKKTGISRMSVKRILDGSPSMSFNKFVELAESFGLRASRVIAEAESMAVQQAAIESVDEGYAPATYITENDMELAARKEREDERDVDTEIDVMIQEP